jgi:hypothetical protein
VHISHHLKHNDNPQEISMYRKKLVYLALATLIPIGSATLAQEAPVSEPAVKQTAVAEEVTAAETAKETAVESTTTEQPAAEAADYAQMSMKDRMKAREQRYEELKKRAEEAGVMLPEHPPWHDREAMMANPQMQKRMEHRQMMQAMTPEERDAYRMSHYMQMREQASEMGIELPENPPWKQRRAAMEEEWAKQQEIIKGMTDEERAACHAMHRRHMREAGAGQGQMMRRQGMRPPMYDSPMQGYGYGPGPYAPTGNYWGPYQQ